MNEKQKKELIRQLTEGTHHWYKCSNCGDILGSEAADLQDVKCPGGCGVGLMTIDREATEQYYSDHIDGAMLWGSESSDYHRASKGLFVGAKAHPLGAPGGPGECWYCVNEQEP